MRVVVTGATGGIGSALCDALLGRGDQVVGLSRDAEKASAARPGIEWHAWDAIREPAPAEALGGAEAIVNLVGEPIDQRWSDAAKKRILESRRRSTHNLIAGVREVTGGPRTLVSQSAVGYYGDCGDRAIDESTPPAARFDSQVCVAWEDAAREAGDAHMRVAILRTGLVLDATHGLLKQLLLPFRLGVGGPLAGGDWYMPWIHLDDEIGLLLFALDNEAVSGVLNACAPNPVTNREFSKALGRALGRPAVMPVPKLALVARLGRQMGDAAVSSQRVVPKRALELGYSFRFPEIEGALRDAVSSRSDA